MKRYRAGRRDQPRACQNTICVLLEAMGEKTSLQWQPYYTLSICSLLLRHKNPIEARRDVSVLPEAQLDSVL